MIGIVGARGFIGRSLVDYFSDQYTPVTAFVHRRRFDDRYIFGPIPRILELKIGVGFEASIFDDIDTLILSASSTNPRTQNNSKEYELKQNVVPHIRFVEDLKKTNIKNIIYLSSGGTVYGDVFGSSPIGENRPAAPITVYGYGKVCIEQMLLHNWRGDDRRLTILRPSNPVGIHQSQSLNQHGLVATVFENLMRDRTIRVFGDGSTIRDYFAVEDLCRLVAFVVKDKSGNRKIMNVSSGQGHSINEIISIGQKVLNKRARIHYRGAEQPRIRVNILSNRAAFSAYGWQPLSSVAEIFARFKAREMEQARIKELVVK